jgi:hypothetical protein
MRRSFRLALAVLPSVFVLLATLSGCNTEEVTQGKKRPAAGGEDEKPRTEVPATKHGTIKGTVVLDDGFNPPAPKPIEMGANTSSCHAGDPTKEEVEDQTWLVGPNRGVKNVAVFVQPPQDMYFKIPEAALDKAAKDVQLEQPHCAFKPRVFTLFPAFYDRAKNDLVPTGQALVIDRSPSIDHNYNLLNASKPAGSNLAKGVGDPARVTGLLPQDRPITVTCNVHSWMRAYGFVLEHPFAAVTNEKGEFTIENAPLGAKLQLVAWHEAAGFFLKGGIDGDEITLQENQTLPPLKIRGK